MEEEFVMIPGSGTKKIVRDVKQEIETAFLDYSMSVIVSRALPDVRDGLKPVHRRILYVMHEDGLTSDKPYRKSATCVGDVLGRYHPHGDASVYDAMVRLAQDFSLRYPLVDGQGNFGSVDGDPPAAYRYTEARMSKMAAEMLTDIEKETIDWQPNFDETKKEPVVLPSRFPNLLVNGSQGIAVGMATNIPPHNLCEVIDGAVALIDNPDIELAELMDSIKGPDFPTGGIIMGRSGIRAAYATGRGKITLRGRASIEEQKNGSTQIIITEIPYMVNKSRLIQQMADMVNEKRIEGIRDLNDESNRLGMRIVVDIKKGANANVVLNQLYQYTQLQDTVGVIMLALDNNVPKVMPLKTMLQRYVAFQDEVVRRRTAYDLKKTKERAHILEGLKKATDIVDELIATIRACKGGMPEAKQAIMDKFGFDDPQADAIVKLQLGRLAGLEILKIENELGELRAKIADYEDILANDSRVLEVVKAELIDIKKRFGDDRRTEIQDVMGEVDIEDLIPEEQCVYTLTAAGYIKRTPSMNYQAQHRGGKGVLGLKHKDEDAVEELLVGSSHDHVLLMTNLGRIFQLRGFQIAEGARTGKGTAVVNLIPINTEAGEKVTNMIVRKRAADGENAFITVVTKKGLIKRTPVSAYANIRRSGLNAIALNEGDAVAWSRMTTGGNELIIATRFGRAIRIHEAEARSMGRTGHGVRAIRLAEGDEVIGVCICREGASLLTVTEHGKGRRSALGDYPRKGRGGKGVRNYDSAKDYVAAVKIVDDTDDAILISRDGTLIRIHVDDLRIMGRYSQGVRVMRLADEDTIAVLARTERDNTAETAAIEQPAEEETIDEAALAAAEAAEEAEEAAEPADDEPDDGDE